MNVTQYCHSWYVLDHGEILAGPFTSQDDAIGAMIRMSVQ